MHQNYEYCFHCKRVKLSLLLALISLFFPEAAGLLFSCNYFSIISRDQTVRGRQLHRAQTLPSLLFFSKKLQCQLQSFKAFECCCSICFVSRSIILHANTVGCRSPRCGFMRVRRLLKYVKGFTFYCKQGSL